MRQLLTLILGACLLVPAAPSPAQNADVTLRYNRWLPPKHHLEQNVFIPWMAKVAEVTQGRVKVEATTSSLGPPLKQYDLAATGIADVVFTSESYTPALFPLAEVMGLPFIGTDVEKLAVAYWQVYERYFAAAKPYPRVVPLGLTGFPIYQIYNARRDISSPDQAKGLKLVTTGGQFRTQLLTAMGFSVIAAGLPQVVEMLSTGVADGTYLTDDALKSFGVMRLIKHRTEFPGGLGSLSGCVLINEAKWSTIGAKDRAAIAAISGPLLSRQMGKSLKDADEQARREIGEAGIRTVIADAAFLALAKSAAAPLDEQWIRMAKEKGVDGAAALRLLRELAQ